MCRSQPQSAAARRSQLRPGAAAELGRTLAPQQAADPLWTAAAPQARPAPWLAGCWPRGRWRSAWWGRCATRCASCGWPSSLRPCWPPRSARWRRPRGRAAAAGVWRWCLEQGNGQQSGAGEGAGETRATVCMLTPGGSGQIRAARGSAGGRSPGGQRQASAVVGVCALPVRGPWPTAWPWLLLLLLLCAGGWRACAARWRLRGRRSSSGGSGRPRATTCSRPTCAASWRSCTGGGWRSWGGGNAEGQEGEREGGNQGGRWRAGVAAWHGGATGQGAGAARCRPGARSPAQHHLVTKSPARPPARPPLQPSAQPLLPPHARRHHQRLWPAARPAVRVPGRPAGGQRQHRPDPPRPPEPAGRQPDRARARLPGEGRRGSGTLAEARRVCACSRTTRRLWSRARPATRPHPPPSLLLLPPLPPPPPTSFCQPPFAPPPAGGGQGAPPGRGRGH